MVSKSVKPWRINPSYLPISGSAPPLMAANALRLRRSLALTSSIFNHKNFFSVLPSVAPSSSPSITQQNPSIFDVKQSKPSNLSFQFISSRAFSSRPRHNNVDMGGDQINPDDVLFEGCDYEHWLITMDFPKDPKPSPEEMVETYVQTAAKVLGRSYLPLIACLSALIVWSFYEIGFWRIT